MGVASRFAKLIDNISLTSDQLTAGGARRESVVKNLNLRYYNQTNSTNHSKFVGSWGKYTRIRPPRDVDVLFELPASVYERFQQRMGNKQSQILSEIRNHLISSYPNTAIKGDGPVVIVPFASYDVEVVPAFRLNDGKYYICMTANGGSYKTADYDAEIAAVSASNAKHKENTRHLIRMMKCWQSYCSVPLKSFWIELLTIEFLDQWPNAGKSTTYYDWMVRDFLAYVKGKKNGYLFAPGTYELMALGDSWHSRADSAHSRAAKACDYETDYPSLAGDEWQKIFGTEIPRNG